jgi:hypothetical protein
MVLLVSVGCARCDDRGSRKALLSASYGEKTVSNFGERSGPAEGKVSWNAKYIIDGGRSNALSKPSFAIRTGELSML